MINSQFMENQCMNKKDFLAFIKIIKELAEIYERKGTLNNNSFVKLNCLSKELHNGTDITVDILRSFADSLINELMKNKIIII